MSKKAFYRAQLDKELSENPDIRALDDPSAKDGSVAPSTAATDGNTPQPTPSGPPTRIKLVSNSAAASSAASAAAASAAASNGTGSSSQVNGGSSGAQSDED
jgi:ATP-dependent helicase STH1/SNF2